MSPKKLLISIALFNKIFTTLYHVFMHNTIESFKNSNI